MNGFTVTYSCGAPKTLSRTSRTTWSTPQGALWDPHQHVVEIDAGSRLLSFGWRGDGPIRAGVSEVGPWMLEFLVAAGFPPGPRHIEEQMVAYPTYPSPWRACGSIDFAAYDRAVATSLTYAVVGYERTIARRVETGTGFSMLRGFILQDHRSSRAADRMLRRERGRTSSFELRAWAGHRKFRGEQPKVLPDFRYWIASESIALAADLLVAFSREALPRGDLASDLAA